MSLMWKHVQPTSCLCSWNPWATAFFRPSASPSQQPLAQAALTMQGMTFHAQNQIFKRLEPTVTDHPVYLLTEGCDWFCGSKLLSNWSCLRKVTDSLGIIGAWCSVQSQQPDRVWCQTWMTYPPSIHGVPLEFSLKILRQVEFHKGSALNADSLQHLQKIVTWRDD